jgi:asparagine synthase (glutamine-hydrolysing)
VSTIAGILHLDGRPVSRDDLSRLSGSLSHRIGDAEGVWIDGAVGLFARALHTTPEAVREAQPWHDARLAIAFDGRLDNRGELASSLKIATADCAGIGDAELVGRACLRWGADCAAHLLGDFAFAAWDRLERRLYCARDVFGVRPFCYRLDASRLLWAPEPHALLRYDNRAAAPNEGVVGEFLANAVTDKRETLLAGVMRLPPAHTLTADARGVRVSRYWDIDPSRELRYSDEREYVEHLQALLRDAVTSRLRVSAAPVGLLLSSGLDSSTVLGVARTFMPGLTIRAYTLAAPGAADESPGARLTADHWRVPHSVGAVDLAEPLPLVGDVRRYLDLPDYPSATVAARLRARVRADGARVLLTGLASDDWFGGSLFRYADLLRGGALGAFARSMWQASRAENFDGWYPSLRAAVWPLVPPRGKRLVLRALGRPGVPPWIDAAFARRIDLADRIRRHMSSAGFPTLARYDVCREGFSAWTTHALEFHDRLEAVLGIEHRHPFYDRRIVEFAVALPESLRWRNGEAKYLLRRAAAPYVPIHAQRRVNRPDYSPLLTRTLATHGAAARFAAPRIAEAGWVDRVRVRAMYERMAGRAAKGDFPDNIWTVWTLFAVELWRAHAIEAEYN